MKSAETTEPLVSVVIPTYNHGAYICEALDSVLNQTYQNFKIIIVDNYSEDETERLIGRYGDRRLQYVKYRNHGIIAASRNHGILNTRGDSAFLDSDDIWLPEMLEKGVDVLNHDGDTAMVYSRFRTITRNTISQIILPREAICRSGHIFNQLYINTFIACSGVTVRRSVLDEVGLFDTSEEMVTVEDTDLWLRIARRYPIACSHDAPLFLYRIQPHNMSRGYLNKLRGSLVLKKRYSEKVSIWLFLTSLILPLVSVTKQKIKGGF